MGNFGVALPRWVARWLRLFPRILLSVGLFFGGPSLAKAQDVSVRAYLTPPNVGVGRTFTLNVQIEGTQNVDSEPQLPDLSPFASYLGSGSSTNMQVINGRTSVSLIIQYRYQALREGTFQIPSMEVEAGGQTLNTEPLQIDIATGQAPPSGQTGASSNSAEISPEDLFLTAEASKSSVREGEPLVVEYRIFTRVNVSSYDFTTIPEPKGFWVEELPLSGGPKVEQVTRNGIPYTSAVIRRVALIPTGSGTRTVEPLGIEAQVRVRRQGLDPFEGFFNLDRSSLFGTLVASSALSNPLTITVDPLPPGRPEPFSGVVGSLSLSATLDKDSVEANEAVTLTVRARGQGNLRAIPEPALNLPEDFETYPPEVSEDAQWTGDGLEERKTWKTVLIPRAPGRRAVPAISMAYFDAEEEAYQMATTPPLPLTVTGEVREGPAPGVRGGVANLREDIRFIHLGPARLTPSSQTLFQAKGFWAIFLLPMAAVLSSLLLRRHQDRLETDPAYARQRKAGRVARKRLAKARSLMGMNSPREFYAEMARALRGFLADKLNVAEAGMQLREATQTLAERGASKGVIEEIAACLDHCDRQRFAPPDADDQAEGRFLERVEEAMTKLNREVRR